MMGNAPRVAEQRPCIFFVFFGGVVSLLVPEMSPSLSLSSFVYLLSSKVTHVLLLKTLIPLPLFTSFSPPTIYFFLFGISIGALLDSGDLSPYPPLASFFGVSGCCSSSPRGGPLRPSLGSPVSGTGTRIREPSSLLVMYMVSLRSWRGSSS
ncbi:hypothetical protein F4778DRAFT_715408 [Xylariomycetidae sp. FL2044]|nr:hypothetical protein F4778DRAFT_715408 [Xylariomycetidae sp. FL2044]